MQIPLRMLALFAGIFGAVIGFVINLLNSSLRFVAQIVGFTNSGGHLFIGTIAAIVAFIGALLVIVSPEAGAILLILAAIAFFFAIGWWAIIPAVFLVLGAWLAMRGRAERRAERRSAVS